MSTAAQKAFLAVVFKRLQMWQHLSALPGWTPEHTADWHWRLSQPVTDTKHECASPLVRTVCVWGDRAEYWCDGCSAHWVG